MIWKGVGNVALARALPPSAIYTRQPPHIPADK